MMWKEDENPVSMYCTEICMHSDDKNLAEIQTVSLRKKNLWRSV